MLKKKRMLLMLLGGGMSQSDIAAVTRSSKRDVSAAAKAIASRGLTVEAVHSMPDAAVEEMLSPPREPKPRNPGYLQPDMDALAGRKARNRRLPVKQMWLEYCDGARDAGLMAYAYQTFCEMFADATRKAGATMRFEHRAAEKAFIDWAGDTAWLTDRLTKKRMKVYMLVVCLPCSCYFFAEGFCDMKQDSWLKGHMDAFEFFGGVPQMLVPDNCSTATNRSAAHVTLLNGTYERFAEHYGTAVVPARVRKPRDKSLAEGTCNLIEQWIIAPACERTFYTLEEFNDYAAERVEWLNARGFSDKAGSRLESYMDGERGSMLALPASRFETYEPRRPKAAPDYHVRIDYMHYSVPYRLMGEYCDARLYASRVVISHAGEVVAEHPRLYGRKGQFHTAAEHMPPNHAMQDSPWSSERFEKWADRIGPATGEAVRRIMANRTIVQQSFTACRNVLGLSKAYAPELLERACGLIIAVEGCVPSYTAVKNAILAIRSSDAEARASGAAAAAGGEEPVDRAKGAGRVRGADAWKRKGGANADG